MRRSIATVSLSGTLPEKLEAVAAARFDGVEIFESDLTFYNGSPRDIRRLCGDLGVAIDMFQPFRDCEGVDDAQFQRNLDRAERKFDLMGELGAPLLLVCANATPHAIDDLARSAEQMRVMAERASRHGIRIAFEALAWSTHINRFDQAWQVVEKANHPHLGLALDSFHTLALPHDWSGLVDLPGDRMFYMQLADAPRLDMATLMLSRHYRCLPGQGELDVPGFVDAALRAGYAGTISLEIFNDGFRAAPPRQTAKDGMRSLLYVEECVRQREDARHAARKAKSQSARRVGLFDPPPAPVVEDVAFIEFAVEGASRTALVQEIESIGFQHVGQHRSKNVSLYAQGSARLVVNSEQGSLAHSHYLLHGPTVCALAFDVDDPIRAIGRAEAYGMVRIDGRLGPEETTIPAIRALDGTLIYFTAKNPEGKPAFERDFLPASDASGKKSALAGRIDHIAQGLPEGFLDASVLFFRTILDLQPEPTVIIPDPYGLVRSRAISDARRRVRFPLNISGARKTATSRSLNAYAGGGVHHIAFETSDIFASARALAMNNAPVLPIPRNYYDDLVARFALEDRLIDEMSALNILYDRVGEAEFFQVFTQPFQDRFFFEFVERRNGYDQYGAPNASVRMAAQAQLPMRRAIELET